MHFNGDSRAPSNALVGTTVFSRIPNGFGALFVCLDRALAQFPLCWCQVNGVQSSYCNDFETKVELERVVITVLLGTAPVP